MMQQVDAYTLGAYTMSYTAKQIAQMKAEEAKYTPEQIELLYALKTGTKYRETMCLQIIEMFSRGKTLAHFCATNLISRDTYGKWRRNNKLFDEASYIAHDKARDYWDAKREQYLEEEYLRTEKGETQISNKLHWGAFNKMYSARFNIADKRAVRVKGLGKAKDERAMLKCLSQAIEDQELTPDEAQKLASLIDVSIKIKTNQEMEQRLDILETAHKTGLS